MNLFLEPKQAVAAPPRRRFFCFFLTPGVARGFCHGVTYNPPQHARRLWFVVTSLLLTVTAGAPVLRGNNLFENATVTSQASTCRRRELRVNLRRVCQRKTATAAVPPPPLPWCNGSGGDDDVRYTCDVCKLRDQTICVELIVSLFTAAVVVAAVVDAAAAATELPSMMSLRPSAHAAPEFPS